MKKLNIKQNLQEDGFTIIENIYSKEEVKTILQYLEKHEVQKSFGVRYFLKLFPSIHELIFNNNILTIIKNIAPNANIIKSIYFDKPPHANWIVNWHQDLTINVEGKINDTDYKNWRVLTDRTVVQPPLYILNNIFTIRIHLNKCTTENGALRIVKNSHLQGITPLQGMSAELSNIEKICEVDQGGILIMKPLLFHSSRRTENNKNRRVIHIEFCDVKLPEGLTWKEFQKTA